MLNRAPITTTAPATAMPAPITPIDQFARPYSLPVKALLGLPHYLFRARRFQHNSPDAIADYQLTRLQHVIRVAAERDPFYLNILEAEERQHALSVGQLAGEDGRGSIIDFCSCPTSSSLPLSSSTCSGSLRDPRR
jgi:hypothetical protein